MAGNVVLIVEVCCYRVHHVIVDTSLLETKPKATQDSPIAGGRVWHHRSIERLIRPSTMSVVKHIITTSSRRRRLKVFLSVRSLLWFTLRVDQRFFSWKVEPSWNQSKRAGRAELNMSLSPMNGAHSLLWPAHAPSSHRSTRCVLTSVVLCR